MESPSISQLQHAVDAWIASRGDNAAVRRERLEAASMWIERTQARIRSARASAHRTRLRVLRERGYAVSKLPSCIVDTT